MNSPLRETERPSGAAPFIPSGLDGFLVLVRHGETDMIVDGRFQGQLDSHLTELGERQLALAGGRLARPHADPPLPIPDVPPVAIVHSPLARAERSAELIADAIRDAGRTPPPLRPEAGLTEIGQGSWEGLTHAEITERFGDSLAAWRRWPERAYAPGGESLGTVQARVVAALARATGELADGAVPGTLDRHQVLGYAGHEAATQRWSLLVAHAGIFRVVVLSLLGLGLDHFWNVDFAPGAITIVELRAGRAVLRSLNLDAHLGPALAETAAEETAKRDASGAL